MLTDTLNNDFITFKFCHNVSTYVNYNNSYQFKINSRITSYIPGIFCILYLYISFDSFVDGLEEDCLNRKLGIVKRKQEATTSFTMYFFRLYINMKHQRRLVQETFLSLYI